MAPTKKAQSKKSELPETGGEESTNPVSYTHLTLPTNREV
ncbi:hypothetical protein JMUB7536_27800 [Staphylococcus aureus]